MCVCVCVCLCRVALPRSCTQPLQFALSVPSFGMVGWESLGHYGRNSFSFGRSTARVNFLKQNVSVFTVKTNCVVYFESLHNYYWTTRRTEKRSRVECALWVLIAARRASRLLPALNDVSIFDQVIGADERPVCGSAATPYGHWRNWVGIRGGWARPRVECRHGSLPMRLSAIDGCEDSINRMMQRLDLPPR